MVQNREVEEEGFALKPRALSSTQLAELLKVVFSEDRGPNAGPAPHALRNVLWARPGLAMTLTRQGVDDIAAEALGASAFAINALYFDKTSRADWKVPCHQDLVVPVRAEVDEPGFSGWTVKVGCSVAKQQEIFYLWCPLLPDPKDDMVAELAVASGADAIVTHNLRDFGEVARFGIKVFPPRILLQTIGALR